MTTEARETCDAAAAACEVIALEVLAFQRAVSISNRSALASLVSVVEATLLGMRALSDRQFVCQETAAAEALRVLHGLEIGLREAKVFGLGLQVARGMLFPLPADLRQRNGESSDGTNGDGDGDGAHGAVRRLFDLR